MYAVVGNWMTPTVQEKPEEPSRGHEGHEESPGCLAWGLFPLLETQFQLDGEVGAGKHRSRDSEAHRLTH